MISKLYFVLPEDRRSIARQEVDYILLPIVYYDERYDYVWENSNSLATNKAFDSITTVYLCAPDGSFVELCRIRHEPPSKGKPPLRGGVATAEEIWDEIAPMFTDDSEPETWDETNAAE